MMTPLPLCLQLVQVFLGPVATLIAATVAAYFVRAQWRTAQMQADTAIDQLRWNLFSKRYAIYDEVKKLLRLLLNDIQKPGFSAFEAMQHFVVIDEAIFFFSPETCEWLESLKSECQKLIEINSVRGTSEYKPSESLELSIKLADHFKEMPERFRTELGFRQLTRITNTGTF
jgi:hypothetical protein